MHKKAVPFVEVIEKSGRSVGRDGLNQYGNYDLLTQVRRGVLISQSACWLLAFAREAIDSSRAIIVR